MPSPHAMDAFLRERERRAYTVALVATHGHKEDALDIVQDAMLAMFRSYASHPAEQWGALFHRVLHSRINDWHRRRSLRMKFMLPWFGTQDATTGVAATPDAIDEQTLAPPEAIARERQQQLFMQRLQTLPLRQQQAFMLRAWDGLDTAAAATAMGCSAGSVKTHFSRAMHSLRAILDDATGNAADEGDEGEAHERLRR